MNLRKLITAAFPLTLALLLLTGVIDMPTARADAGGVVIGEFRTRGPLGDNDEFVELYNASSAPVNIGNWTLRGANNLGAVVVLATVPVNVVMPPGCHYLFANNTSGTGYSGTVAANKGYTSPIVDNGSIAIYDGPARTGSRVDAVGLSNTAIYREGNPLPPFTTNTDQSYERKPGGALGNGQDTEDNATDFVVSAPSNPQNSSSACVSAGITATGAATPSAVDAGAPTLFTVTVFPSNTPGVTVTADLSPIGGAGNASFYDNGTNGDASAGDGVFSLSYLLPSNVGLGAKAITATANDGAGHTASVTISLVVNPPQYTIMQIQGSVERSPLEGQTVQTTGVVYDVAMNGFWMQDPNGDGDPTTSDGIFVSTSSSPTVQLGDNVSVAGLVSEVAAAGDPSAAPETELTSPGVTVLTTGNTLPAPVTITAADIDPNASIDQLERFEGMRVHIDTLNVVSPTGGVIDETNATAASNGVFFGVIPGLQRPFRTAGIELPATVPAGSPCCIPSWNGAPQRIRVDTLTLSAALDVTTGAAVSNLTGPLDFRQHSYTIVTESTPAINSGNLAAIPVPIPDVSEFTVASFEMQRFFDTVEDPTIPDAVLTQAAFNNRLNKASLAIRNVMMTPDIIGVQEVENLATLQALANKVNNDAVAAGSANPGYSAYLVSGNDTYGLNVGFMVTSRITVNSVNQYGRTDTFVQPDGTTALINDRPPLVLDATVTNQGSASHFIAITVHQLALNGIDDAVNGPLVRAKRRAQAEYLANLIQSFQTADPAAKIVAVGNFNAYSVSDGYVDATGTVEGNPTLASEVVLSSSDLVDPNMTDLETTLAPEQRYSYVNLGTAETLDHMLVSQGMMGSLTRFAYARNGADYPEVYRNNQNRPERISDHDMPVAYFKLPQDHTPPVLTLPTDFTVEATSSAGAVVTFTATAMDAVDGSTAVTCNPASGSSFALGTTNVSCTSQDAHNNVAGGSFNVTVSDTTPPSLTLPSDFAVGATSAAGAVVTYSATALDTVSGSTPVLCNPASGGTFPLGTTTVSCTTQDAQHNVANGTFHVSVVDNTAPLLTLPADISVAATSASGAVVTFSATALDAVDGATAVTCNPASGSTFPMGTTTVSCTTQDAQHNVSSGTFHVSVADNTAPVLTLPADISGAATSASGAVVTFSATALDAVDGATAVTCNPGSGSTFPLGTTTVSCTTQDAQHNVASGTFHVSVVDNTAPVLTLPADISVAATSASGAVLTFSATALDAVDGATAVTCNPGSGSNFPLGTTTVSCTSQDTHHNLASGTFHVSVIGSSAPPIVKVTGVINGAQYVLGSVPAAGCSTVAGGSPIAVNASLKLTGGNANGVGNFTATCSGAQDVSGVAAAPVSATYTVSYVWSGFLFLDRTVFESGSTIPLAWTLTNAKGKMAGSLSSFVSLQIAANPDCAGAPEGALFTAATPGGSGLTYSDGLFQINWKTTNLASGCYSILLKLDDGSMRSTIVQLKSDDDGGKDSGTGDHKHRDRLDHDGKDAGRDRDDHPSKPDPKKK